MSDAADEHKYASSEVWQLLGVSIRQLERWHRSGLAKASAQTQGGHRRYTARDLVRIRVVQALISARFRGRPLRRAVEAAMRTHD